MLNEFKRKGDTPFNFSKNYEAVEVKSLEDRDPDHPYILIVESERSHRDSSWGEKEAYSYTTMHREVYTFDDEAKWKKATLALYQMKHDRTDIWAFKAGPPLRPTVSITLGEASV